MFSKKFLFIQFIILALFISFVGLRFLHVPAKPLPILGHVDPFSLTDPQGRVVTLSDLEGQVWVADFVFTTCGSICPTLTSNMASLQNMFKSISDVKMVSFSVDPEHDTPEVLAKFAAKFKADLHGWYFLTGTREQLTDVAVHSFKLGDIKEPIFHSPNFALVDRKGNIRAYYDGTEKANMALISKDIRSVFMEK